MEWYKQFPESNSIYGSKHYSWMDENGVYFPSDISGPNFGQYRYDVIHPFTGKICKEPASGWRFPQETMLKKIEENTVHFGKDETTIPNNKTYLKDTEIQSLTSIKYKDGRVASKLLNNLLGGTFFTNPKDVEVLKSLIKAVGVNTGDIVLDFFSGSASTAQAIIELNKENNTKIKFIMTQLPEDLLKTIEKVDAKTKKTIKGTIDFLTSINKPLFLSEIGKERIRRAGEKIKEEFEKENEKITLEGKKEFTIDIGFKVFKIDSTNFKEWETSYDYLEKSIKQSAKGEYTTYKTERTELDLVYEIILKQNFMLTEKLDIINTSEGNIYKVAKGITYIFLNKVTTSVVDKIIELKKEVQAEYGLENPTVILNEAYIDTGIKTNAIQNFKSNGITNVITV